MAGLGDGAGVGAGASGGSSSGGAGDGQGAGGSGAAGSSGAASGGTSGAGGGTGGSSGAGTVGSGGAGGTAQPSWRDSLPDELKTDPTLNKYSDLQNLARAHVELQKKFGQKGIFKPAPDASKEEILAFREALGIPTEPSKYDLGKFEGVEVPPTTLQWAQKVGAEHGIEPQALKAVITDYMKMESQVKAHESQQSQAAMVKGLESLRQEWGDAFDRNITRANFAAEKLGGKALVERLVELKVHNDPALIKALSEAAKLYGEDRLREAGAGDGRHTPQELDSEIERVRSQLISLPRGDGRRGSLLNQLESLSKQKTGGR